MSDIGVARLRSWGIAGIVLDLDNTIVPWHTAQLAADVEPWISTVRGERIRLCLLTNNHGAQAVSVAQRLSAPIVRAALKPNPLAFRRAAALLEAPPSACLVVGDQLFTDVLGAKLVGMRAVLVEPIGGREFPTTKIMRAMEQPILRYLRRQGRLAS